MKKNKKYTYNYLIPLSKVIAYGIIIHNDGQECLGIETREPIAWGESREIGFTLSDLNKYESAANKS